METKCEVKDEIPKGYCRYCSYAAYQGDNYAVCTADNRMGQTVRKDSRRKTCENFDFNPFDVFSPDFGDGLREYKPRKPKSKGIQGQLSLFGED